MPFQREHVQFALIFLCVPIQYFIVQNSGSSESSRSHQISLIVKQVTDFQKHWLSPESWTKWCQKILLDRPDPGTGTVNNFAYCFTGNALARVQRVHEPADLWDITLCTH